MTEVTRLQGKTLFGTYVVSIFVTNERLDKIEVAGTPHRSVSDLCKTLGKTKTRLCDDSIKAIKLTMAKHCEYYGEKH